MVEDRPWGADADQELQLREKINTYASYVFDGSLTENYPELSGRHVIFELVCPEPPSGNYAGIIAHGAERLAAYGIEFLVTIQN